MNSHTIPIIKVYLIKNLYDPLIGQESLTTIEVVGVLFGHMFFGIAATLLIDWSWIPLSPQQKESGRSLKDIKKSWGWEENTNRQDEYLNVENKKTSIDDDNE